MEALYYILHQPGDKRKLAEEIAPELLPIINRTIQGYLYSNAMFDEIKKLYGDEALTEFINLHTDDEKFEIASISYNYSHPICLDTQYVINRSGELNEFSARRHLTHAIICNSRELFDYLLNHFGGGLNVLSNYFLGVSYNPEAINWINDVYMSIRPESREKLILHLCITMRKYPNLAAHAKYVFDFLMEKLDLPPNMLANRAIVLVTELPNEHLVNIGMFTLCEILNSTGYFDYDFFVGLANQYPGAPEWLKIHELDV